jgi:hypothetical protein
MKHIQIFIILIISFLIALLLNIQYNLFVKALLIFWLINLIFNLFSKKLLNDQFISLTYIIELFSLLFLIPLFIVIGVNVIVSSILVFGLSEIILELLSHLKSNPIQK